MEKKPRARQRSPSALLKQKELSVEGFKSLEAGLELDTPSASEANKSAAIRHYARGLEILREATCIKFTQEQSVCAAKLHEKMLKNMALVEERLRVLTKEVRSQTPCKRSFQARGIDPTLADVVLSNLVEETVSVTWSDVIGLDAAKRALNEMIVLPNLRPDIFCGLRAPSKGLLLFGPPGNGKTLLARALAHEAKARFFNVSAASLTSKYLGEGEKLVRTLFGIAREVQPSIVFIDEIDSLLSERNEKEHEASRRLKTEFMVQLDGVQSNCEDRVIVVGATNLPQTLDEAVRRRLSKRVYIPLPDASARKQIVKKLLEGQKASLNGPELEELAALTKGYSGSDLADLCKEAAFEPVREVGSAIRDLPVEKLRPIQMKDFAYALSQIRPSVEPKSLARYEEWNRFFGSKTSS